MASLPKEIFVKRKRLHDDEDDVPAYLQIDNDDPISKRRMSGNFVYRRRIAKGQSAPASGADHDVPDAGPELAPPVIKTKQPTPRKSTATSAISTDGPVSSPLASQAIQGTPTSQPTSSPAAATRPDFQPRRFHMSRSLMNAKNAQSPRFGPQGVTKKRHNTAVFIERAALKHADMASLATTAPAKNILDVDMSDSSVARKKPGTRRLQVKAKAKEEDTSVAAAAAAAPVTAPAAPVSQHKPLPDVAPTTNTDQLADEMDKWVLHEIGVKIKEMEVSSAAAKNPASPSKYKPKAPAQRFAERNPALAARLDAEGSKTQDSVMQDADADLSDDDYEIVVYELAPNDGPGGLGSIPPEQIGVLKFDTREDMELFYGNEDDDSDWVPDDDEDENAENHYTAEYPEELDSDDSEFDGGGAAAMGHYGELEDDDDKAAAYYRAGMREFEGDYADDEDDDRYIVEGDNESRDRDEVFQERIRRYIRRYGSN